MLKNIHVHFFKKRTSTKNLNRKIHIHVEKTESLKPVQFQNRCMSLRSLAKRQRVWQFPNLLSLKQMYLTRGGEGQMNWGEPFPPPMAADCHRIYVVTCVVLNITIYHLLPKNIVQNTKLRVSDFLVVSNSVLLSNLRSKTDEKNGGS